MARSLPLLNPQYDLWLVLVSLLIAAFASFVALDLARRVRDPDRRVAFAWGAGGSVTLGTGIWAMHFVGMIAFSLPIELGYGYVLTALSWVAAVAVSGLALALASSERLTAGRLAAGAVVMGAGICAMHYTGMAALDMQPGIVWDPLWLGLSVLIAVAASAAALTIFAWMRSVEARHARRAQMAAALVMGLAIGGMHYSGMAAANFPAGSVCLSAGALGGGALAVWVFGATAALLLVTLLTSMLDGRLRGHSARLALSLQAANAELVAANAELKTLAFRDPLTGLANRLLFEDRLQHAVARVDRLGDAQRLAVLYVALDGFKPINGSLGHARGDQVLRETARRLREVVRESDSVARVGGDEFVLALETTNADDGSALARRIIEAIGAPQDLAGRRFSVSASVGVALYPDDGGADKLLAYASTAVYAAKRAGGGHCVRFGPDMVDPSLEQFGLQQDLRHAVAKGQLTLHYQPKVDARSGTVQGLEALLRWQHPTLGAVSPAVFIPLAEQFGMIAALGDWVIDEACRQMGEWAAAGQRQRVAINVSAHQLHQQGLVAHIEQALQRHGLDVADLLCEITESHWMDDLALRSQVFEDFERLGVFLSIDDFGTGHSSLSRLRHLPASQLKIDRSFVADLNTGPEAQTLIKAIVAMAHALGLRVVAEGVETEAQRALLAQLGCDELQGYLIARPMRAADVPAWVAAQAARTAPARPASAQGSADEVQPVLPEVQL